MPPSAAATSASGPPASSSRTTRASRASHGSTEASERRNAAACQPHGARIGGPDPSGFDAIYQCYDAAKNLGGSNYKRYCSKKVDSLIKKGEANFNANKRTAQYQQAAKITSNAISVIPLYAPPQIFVYKKALQGASKSNNPTSEGPTWNLQSWHWGS